MIAPKPLTFAALDGLAFAAERGRLSEQPSGAELSAGALGPLLELEQLSASGLLPRPDMAAWLSLDDTRVFEAALHSGLPQWICPATRAAGFFRTAPKRPEDNTPWVGFGLAAQKAATAAGFHRQIAAQFVGVLSEMLDNIYEHSGAPASGIVAFRAGDGEFEFVVADGGIGVLESLKTCLEYAELADCGEALRLALEHFC